MSSYLHVTVTSISADTVVLQLPDGTEYEWPATDIDDAAKLKVGDKFILTLTTSHAILNELMRTSNDQATPIASQSQDQGGE